KGICIGETEQVQELFTGGAGSWLQVKSAAGRPERTDYIRNNHFHRRQRATMTSRAKTEYRYEKLTWPEINDAVELGKVCVVPCGAVEQHGPHLPLDVDLVCPVGIATGAGKEIADKLLVLPVVAYGYTGHVMDFP